MWSDQAYYFTDSSFQLELNLQCVRRSLIQTLDEFEAVDCTRCYTCNYLKCRCNQAAPKLKGSRAGCWFGQGPSLIESTPGQPLPGTTPPQSQIGAIPIRSLTSSGQYTDAVESLPGPLTEPTPGQSLIGTTPPQSQTGSIPLQSPIGSRQDTDALMSPPAIDLPRPDFEVVASSSETNDQPGNDVESWVRTSTPNPYKTVSPGSKINASNFSWPPTPITVWNDYKNKINKPEINTATVSQASNVQDFFKSFNLNSIGARHTHAQNRALMEALKFMASTSKQPEYTYF